MKWVIGYCAGQAALISFVFLAVAGSVYWEAMKQAVKIKTKRLKGHKLKD